MSQRQSRPGAMADELPSERIIEGEERRPGARESSYPHLYDGAELW